MVPPLGTVDKNMNIGLYQSKQDSIVRAEPTVYSNSKTLPPLSTNVIFASKSSDMENEKKEEEKEKVHLIKTHGSTLEF